MSRKEKGQRPQEVANESAFARRVLTQKHHLSAHMTDARVRDHGSSAKVCVCQLGREEVGKAEVLEAQIHSNIISPEDIKVIKAGSFSIGSSFSLYKACAALLQRSIPSCAAP